MNYFKCTEGSGQKHRQKSNEICVFKASVFFIETYVLMLVVYV